VSWNPLFSEPIILADGSELATLNDAYDHLNGFPKSDQDTEGWKAAANYLIEAAERGGSVAFARIGVLRTIKQQISSPILELIDLTMRGVQQLTTHQIDPPLPKREAPRSLPGVIEVLVAIVSSPAEPIKLDVRLQTDASTSLLSRPNLVTKKLA
jgi:hypothetical protein